jgi:hypothetical protein
MTRKPSVVNGKENLLPIKGSPHHIPANNSAFPAPLMEMGRSWSFPGTSPAFRVWGQTRVSRILFNFEGFKKAISGGGELYYITFYLPYTTPMDTARRHLYLNYLDSYPKFSSLTSLSSWIPLKHKHSSDNSASSGLSGPDSVLLFNEVSQDLVNYLSWDSEMGKE